MLPLFAKRNASDPERSSSVFFGTLQSRQAVYQPRPFLAWNRFDAGSHLRMDRLAW